MIGLFQENGPCNFPVNGSTEEPTLNPYSWNNYAVSDRADCPPMRDKESTGKENFANIESEEYALRRPANWHRIQLRD